MTKKFSKYNYIDKPIDIFWHRRRKSLCRGGKINNEDEGKRKLLDNNGYLIDNPNYRFKEYEKEINLFSHCKLG